MVNTSIYEVKIRSPNQGLGSILASKNGVLGVEVFEFAVSTNEILRKVTTDQSEA